MIISSVPKNVLFDSDNDFIKKDILFGVSQRIGDEISIGLINSYMTISNNPHSYELVKWKSEPYTIQANDEKMS